MSDVQPGPIRASGTLEVLRSEAEAMLEYALENGIPVTAALVGQVAGVDPTTSAAERDGMVAAHIELARLIRPASPDGVATLRNEREDGWWRFLGPVKLVRFLMGLTIVALLAFLGLVVFAKAPAQLNDTMQGASTAATALEGSKLEVFQRLAYLLSAAVLGATFGQLYRVQRYIGNGTYDRRLDSTYTTNVVLGAVAGIVLAILIPLEEVGSAEAGLTKPLLALLGGFSARAVHRILSRLVDSVETLVRGDPREEVAAAEKATETRAASETSQLLAEVSSGVSAAGQAMAAGQTQAAQDQLASVQASLLAPGPATAMVIAPPPTSVDGGIETPPTTNGIPTDGVDDSRSDEELADPDTGLPWGDAEGDSEGMIPGRDFDPKDDPDNEEVD